MKVGFNVVNSLIREKYSVSTDSLLSHFNGEDVPNNNPVKIQYQPKGLKTRV